MPVTTKDLDIILNNISSNLILADKAINGDKSGKILKISDLVKQLQTIVSQNGNKCIADLLSDKKELEKVYLDKIKTKI